MTWSYDPTTVGTVPANMVRLLIGDTLVADPQMQDEEIAALLGVNDASPLAAAIQCCRALAARFARQVSTSLEGVRSEASSRSQHYLDLAGALERQAADLSNSLGAPLVTGIRISEERIANRDHDRVKGKFRVGQTDYPGPFNDPLAPDFDPHQ